MEVSARFGKQKQMFQFDQLYLIVLSVDLKELEKRRETRWGVDDKNVDDDDDDDGDSDGRENASERSNQREGLGVSIPLLSRNQFLQSRSYLIVDAAEFFFILFRKNILMKPTTIDLQGSKWTEASRSLIAVQST